MTWIKICGITNLEDARVAVEAGADALGFVFYEKSPRNVDPEKAREISARLPAKVEKVGVFVNEPPGKIASIADRVQLTAVQLHVNGQYAYEELIIDKKIYLALTAKAETQESANLPFMKKLAAVFVDSDTVGGTGKSFDWQEASSFFVEMGKSFPMVAAGGLTPENVADAICILKPWGVDVSSGVEASPGKKDPEKVRAFIAAVRHADGNH